MKLLEERCDENEAGSTHEVESDEAPKQLEEERGERFKHGSVVSGTAEVSRLVHAAIVGSRVPRRGRPARSEADRENSGDSREVKETEHRI